VVAEAQQELVIVDFDIQFLLALCDRFLHVFGQQLDELPGPPAPEALQPAQQRVRVAYAQRVQAPLYVYVHP
jgi:hypothetical protein